MTNLIITNKQASILDLSPLCDVFNNTLVLRPKGSPGAAREVLEETADDAIVHRAYKAGWIDVKSAAPAAAAAPAIVAPVAVAEVPAVVEVAVVEAPVAVAEVATVVEVPAVVEVPVVVAETSVVMTEAPVVVAETPIVVTPSPAEGASKSARTNRK
jgi:hypothetical protein